LVQTVVEFTFGFTEIIFLATHKLCIIFYTAQHYKFCSSIIAISNENLKACTAAHCSQAKEKKSKDRGTTAAHGKQKGAEHNCYSGINVINLKN
jgi:hypothetical protein